MKSAILDTLNDLPDAWVWTTIGEITAPVESVDPTQNPHVPFVYIDISSIDNSQHRIVEPKRYFGKDAPSRARQQVKPGDVLLSTVRPYLRNIAYVTDTLEGAIASTGFAVLRAENGVDGKFIFYYVLTDAFVKSLSELQRGVSYPAVRDSDVREQTFPLAPSSEQHRIVEAIESYFSRLDAAEAALCQAQARLAHYKTALLKAACEGRLVPTEAELAAQTGRAYEPASELLGRILQKRRAKWEEDEWARLVERAKQRAAAEAGKPAEIAQDQSEPLAEAWLDIPETAYKKYLPKGEAWKSRYPEPAQPNTTELPEIPDGWCWATVEQLGNVQLGRQRSPKNHQGPFMRPYLRAANATWDGVDLSDVLKMNFPPDDFERYQLHVGDILLSEASGSASEVGKSFIWRGEIDGCCFQNTLIRVQTNGLSPEYLQLHFLKDAKTGRFGQIAKGVGIHHLGGQRLAELTVALPPLAEQDAIVSEYDRRVSLTKAIESALATTLIKLANMRQVILHLAYSGKLVPQSAEDEPAEMLLEQIRRHREEAMQVESKPKREKKQALNQHLSKESVLAVVLEMPESTFTFEELRAKVAGEYEAVKDIIFELLSESSPTLHLQFDPALKTMVYVRRDP